MSAVAKPQEWVFGEWGNFNDLKIEQLNPILSLFKSEDMVGMDTIKRNRYDAFVYAKKHNLINDAAISAYLKTQEENKLKDLPDEYKALSQDELEVLIDKARSNVEWENYGEGDLWKVKKILHKKIEKKFGGMSLDSFRQLEIAPRGVGGGRTFAITFGTSLTEIPTIAPDGAEPAAIEILTRALGDSAIRSIGRNKGDYPKLTAKTTDGRTVTVSMGNEYAIEVPKKETEAVA